jgi:quercetin dioxygenase-like cupin family protein
VTNVRFGILTSAVLAASTLCAQAAISQQVPTENIGPKEDVLHSVGLGSKIDSALGHSLRSLKLEPGGVAELHSDIGGPTFLHVIRGTLTAHPKGQPEAVLQAGDGFVEAAGINYWIENTGSESVEFIFLHVYDKRVR